MRLAENNTWQICLVIVLKRARQLWLGLCVAGVVAGCTPILPFRYTVTPIIPDALKAKGAPISTSSFNNPSAQAYAVNDKGHVVGVYSPPAPRKGDQIFIFADGKLSTYDYPCSGALHVTSITNTDLIAGHCQAFYGEKKELYSSFLVSYAQPGTLQTIQPAWPTQGFFVSGLNDRGDAIGWNPRVVMGGSANREEFIGFIYVSGQLHMVRRSDLRDIGSICSAKLNSSGLVIGGERKRLPNGRGEFQEVYPFMFKEGKFVELPSDFSGRMASINDSGHWVTEQFGLYDGKFRSVDCGKDFCSASDINNRGWVVGSGNTSYPIPPVGVSFGYSYFWMNDRFYSIDKSVSKSVNSEYPLKISNQGHILFHSDGWPYLLTPETLPH